MAENGKRAPVRVVFEDGKPVALVRAKTEPQAIRHVTRKRYEAPIADQEHLITLAPKLAVEDAGAEDDAEQATLRG